MNILKLPVRVWPALVLAAAYGLCSAPTIQAQAGDPLGDEFIFFVDGVNTLVPSFAGQVVNDPADPGSGNQVLRHAYGQYSYQAFAFDVAVGRDLTENLAQEDMLHLKLWSDTANVGKSQVKLTFIDKTDGSGAEDGSADLEFRANWIIPQWAHNGEWHEFWIPLPPATWQELEDGKTAGTLDTLANYWVYGGAWSNGGFGVALDGQGPNTGERPELWEEFEWTNVGRIGVFFDNNEGGGDIYIDDVFIGDMDTDLSVASQPTDAVSGASFSAAAGKNVISWADNPNIAAYNVYVSPDPITDLTAEGVALLGDVKAADGVSSLDHVFEVPHASLAPIDIYYAVTSLSGFGVENPDISNSAGVISNPDLPVQPSIIQLTEDEGNTLFDNLSAGIASPEGFPEGTRPFYVNQGHSQLSESLTLPDSDEDNSAVVWMGYTDLNELWIYAEVTDDVLEFGGPATPSGDAWQFDTIEIGWGNYDVRDVPGGSILNGSPHVGMERGEFADYQFRIGGKLDTQGNILPSPDTYYHVGADGDGGLEGNAPGAGTVVDFLDDGTGKNSATIGYKLLTLFPLDAIQDVEFGDAVLDPPGADELRLVPMTLTLNDADGNGRDHQITWSLKPTVDNQWWNTPAQWPAVAMAGRNLVATAVEDLGEVPNGFALEQNYPNPFNPTTNIRFELSSQQTVTLTVFDLMGRRVATVVDGQDMAAGTYSATFDASGLASGVYQYKLEAGEFSQTRQMLLLK